MHLQETWRRIKDGRGLNYLQVAHHERHPETGSPADEIIHSFGRAESGREALRRFKASIIRFLNTTVPMAAGWTRDLKTRRLPKEKRVGLEPE